MKKALKIAERLEEILTNNKSDVIIKKIGERVIIESLENRNLLQVLYLALIISPWLIIFIVKSELSLILVIIMLVYSIIIVLSYYKGFVQSDNRIEIDLDKEEIKLIKLNQIGKFFIKERILKTKKDNEILKRNIPLSDTLNIRISMKMN